MVSTSTLSMLTTASSLFFFFSPPANWPPEDRFDADLASADCLDGRRENVFREEPLLSIFLASSLDDGTIRGGTQARDSAEVRGGRQERTVGDGLSAASLTDEDSLRALTEDSLLALTDDNLRDSWWVATEAAEAIVESFEIVEDTLETAGGPEASEISERSSAPF
jgi:hypothetical protein